MDSKFNVLYRGLQEGITTEEFIEKFCSKFGLSEQKARQIAASTSDVVIKKDLDENKAKQYAAALEACGMIVQLDEISAEPAGSLSLEPIAGAENIAPAAVDEAEPETEINSGVVGPKCPKCGSDQIEGDECKACGIYISKYLQNQKNTSIMHDSDAENMSSKEVMNLGSAENNPYATPEASLEKNIVSKEGQGSLEGGINGDYDFTIGEIFGEAWERTKGAKGSLLLAWLFYIVVAIAVNAVFAFTAPDPETLINQGRMSEGMIWAIIPSLVTIPILYPILAGIVLMGIHRSVDADINATSVFGHYGKIIPLTLLTIVMSLLIMLGFILLVLPGIYLAVAYMMAMSLMIDRDMGIWEAMETSRKAITKHWFKVFFLYFLLWLLMIVASIPLLIGLIWVLPLAVIMHGVMYKYMFGVESVE